MEYLDSAKEASILAGDALMGFFGTKLAAERKKDATPVTEADLASNKIILDYLSKKNPSHHFLSEEGVEGASLFPGINWVIDPLDGTSNFMHGLPYFCVSIACVEVTEGKEPEIIAGVVYDPVSKDMYTAKKGGGAFKNGEKLTVSQTQELGKAYIACGYHGDDMESGYGKAYLEVSKNVESCRRLGAAALDLAKTAEGIFDFFFDPALRAWDIAAGALLLREAGGVALNFPGQGPKNKLTILDRGIIGGSEALVNRAQAFFE